MTTSTKTKEPRQPQDHKPKKKAAEEFNGAFSFEYGDETYTLRPTEEVVTPGFLRKNRRRDEVDQFFTMLEGLADEDVLDVIDHMSQQEFRTLMNDFYEHLRVSLPE